MRRDRIEALAIILDISPLTILFSTDDDIFIPQPKKQTDIVGSADEERYELLQAIAALPTDKLKAIIQLSK